MKNKNKKIGQSKEVNFDKFTDKQGNLLGGVDVECQILKKLKLK